MTDARETRRRLAALRPAAGRLSPAAVVLLALLGTACAPQPASSPISRDRNPRRVPRAADRGVPASDER